MSADPRADCANSGKWAPEKRMTPRGDGRLTATCTRCKQEFTVAEPALVWLVGERGTWLPTHLRPGKTLADRR